jgi:extracellular factor (EF) 3-hydroxypalmitic acid methyl ester biosynthesis protein
MLSRFSTFAVYDGIAVASVNQFSPYSKGHVSWSYTLAAPLARHIPLQLEIGKDRSMLLNSVPSSPLQWDVGTVVAGSLLDHVQRRLTDEPDEVSSAMNDLMSGLWWLKSSLTPQAWRSVAEQCVAHPVREVVHEDPFSSRSFHKPRGYAGDAVLIDYIYTRNCRTHGDEAVSPMGEKVFAFNRDTPACAAVRARRDLVAAMLDEICTLADHPQILSVACGHLREATLCRSVAEGQAGRFIALDQDRLSLDVVEQEVLQYGVIPVCNSIRSLFRGEVADERFDFIYSTGLYDYLDDRIATKLTGRLFEMLNPGGRLLVANFLPDIWGAGYMESFMDWKLIYRSPEEMEKICANIEDAQIALRKTFVERNGNIVFMEIARQ